MIPVRGQVRVRASFDGDVELKVALGQRVYTGCGLVVVEGDREIETLSARNAGSVREILVLDGATVKKGDLLVVLDEDPVVS